MDQLVSKNPNPVLQAGTDGRVFYSNKAAEPLLSIWDIGGEGKLPHSVETLIKRVVSRNDPEKMEVKVGKKIVSNRLPARARKGTCKHLRA